MNNIRLRDLVGSEAELSAIQRLRDSLPRSKARGLDKVLSILSSSDGPLSIADQRAIYVALHPVVTWLAGSPPRKLGNGNEGNRDTQN